jgi:hypothetical protein
MLVERSLVVVTLGRVLDQVSYQNILVVLELFFAFLVFEIEVFDEVPVNWCLSCSKHINNRI